MLKVSEKNDEAAFALNERAVVDEFSEVIRKHRDRSPSDLARLARVAFDRSLDEAATRGNKIAVALARGLDARRQLVEAEGGSLSSDEAASLLGISKTAALKRLAAGRLLAWREERLQAARFPRWQFDDYGRVLAGLDAVLKILDRGGHLDVWAKVIFFLQTKSGFGDKRALDLLREGKLEDVCLAAEAYVE